MEYQWFNPIKTVWWHPSDQDNFMLEVFVFYNFPRLNRNCLAKRNSGGLGVFVRNSTKEDVIFIKSFEDVVAWFKLRKDRFQLPNDIYLDNVYVAPEGSSYLNYDVFDLIKEDTAKFPSGTQVLICGHYNARTVRHPMFISTHVNNGKNHGLVAFCPDMCLAENARYIPEASQWTRHLTVTMVMIWLNYASPQGKIFSTANLVPIKIKANIPVSIRQFAV